MFFFFKLDMLTKIGEIVKGTFWTLKLFKNSYISLRNKPNFGITWTASILLKQFEREIKRKDLDFNEGVA